MGKLSKKALLSFGLGCMALLAPFGVASAQTSQADFDKMMDNYLKSENGPEMIAQAMQAHFQRKQQKAQESELENQFKNPVKIDIGNSPVKGPKDAKITIVEFSDFECPFCKKGNDTMNELAKLYPKDIKFVFKNLPLPGHENAEPAAKAALAANKQGKFWEYEEKLFANQRALSEEKYVEFAKELGLNIDQFNKDRASPEIAKQIQADSEQAKSFDISGTPAFFVNGVAVRGAYPISHFKMIIDRLMSGAGSATAKKGDAGAKS